MAKKYIMISKQLLLHSSIKANKMYLGLGLLLITFGSIISELYVVVLSTTASYWPNILTDLLCNRCNKYAYGILFMQSSFLLLKEHYANNNLFKLHSLHVY